MLNKAATVDSAQRPDARLHVGDEGSEGRAEVIALLTGYISPSLVTKHDFCVWTGHNNAAFVSTDSRVNTGHEPKNDRAPAALCSHKV